MQFTKDSFTQNLAQGRRLVPYLEKFDGYDEPWGFQYEPKGMDYAWHPSGDCIPPVEVLYAKAQEPLEIKHSIALQKTFQVGHFWHQLLQRVICEKLGFCEPSAVERKGVRGWGDQIELVPGPDVEIIYMPYHWATGAGDIAPLVLPDGWEGILDIKTMSGSQFKAAKKSGLLPPQFADKYEAQINVYMDLFDQPNGMILAVNKDAPHDFVEFVFERNDALIETVYYKWEYVSVCLDAGEEPDPEANSELVLPFTGPSS